MSRQQKLLNALRRGANSFNGNHAEGDPTMAPVVTAPQNKLFTMGPGKYNPVGTKAQIQIQMLKLIYTEAAGVYTASNAAALLADNVNISFPFFLFANSDFAAGYAKLQAQYPLQAGWQYGDPFVYGKDVARSAFSNLSAAVTGQLRKGDLVIPFTVTSATPTNFVVLIVIRTSDVPYGTLIDATNSNSFNIQMLRYTVATATAVDLAQYANPILISNETMFGKFTTDPVNPDASKNPEQQQENIIDIDISVGINKEKGLSSLFNYDAGNMRWNLFIESVTKV